jgi:hypothetical protein
MILHQTLYNMFPPSSFDPQSIMPLAPQEFIQRILVPEAALTLIMEDTGQDRDKAVQTMRESAGYGVAMFPDTSEGPGIGAGEDIVLERARTRRRELEDEERIEALLCSGNSEDDHVIQTKGTKRSKMPSSSTTTDMEETSTTRHKMKRKKAGSRTDVEGSPDRHVFHGATMMSVHANSTAVQPNVAVDPHAEPTILPPSIHRAKSNPPSSQTSALSQVLALTSMGPQKSTPTPKSTSRNSQTKADGRSMSAPIDVDGPQIVHGTDVSSTLEQPSVVTDQVAWSVEDSSDSQLPSRRPKPRRLMVERGSSVDRRLGRDPPASRTTDQDQWRDSSVE